MLVLSRKPGEVIYVGDVKITVVRSSYRTVRLSFEAPPEIRIVREELRSLPTPTLEPAA